MSSGGAVQAQIELRLVERTILLEAHLQAPACENGDGILAAEAEEGDLLVAEAVGVRVGKKVQRWAPSCAPCRGSSRSNAD